MTQTSQIEPKHIPQPKNGKDRSAAAIKDDVTERVEETLNAAQDNVMQAADQVTEEFHKISESSKQFVRENPGAAVAGALGVGVLLGLALRGRP